MSLVLNTNINSLLAQNSLTTSGNQLSTSLQQLSSGLQINTAADNAAGYAIAQGMTSQINGLNTSINNANDGVSLTQTAQGSLQAITNDLQTMRNLAVQSLNATNSTTDRQDLNTQFQQLLSDINQVASTASFNGVNLLDGSFQGQTFQIGANAGNTITVASVGSVKASNLGQLYTAAGNAVSNYNSTGAAGGTAVANGDSGTFTVKIGTQSYTTNAVTLTGNQATDLKTVAAAITQAVGSAGVVATVNSSGNGIDLSSTTQQVANLSYSATTGSETLATFGLNSLTNMSSNPTYTATSGTTFSSTSLGNALITAAATTSSPASYKGAKTVSVVIQSGTGATGTSKTYSLKGTAAAAITKSTSLATIASDLQSAATSSGATLASAGYTASTKNSALVVSGGTQSFTLKSATITGQGTGSNVTPYNLVATAATAAQVNSSMTMSNLGGTTINTVDASNQVLIQVDAALQSVATTGAQLGAYQNRFQSAVTNLQTDATNLQSAKSQIVDTNYAQATSQLSQAQILQQASTSMVAQANVIPQQILTLLQKLP